MENAIRKLLRQCARWAIAAEQDQSPLIAMLHIQYAAGYLWAIQDIATADEFAAATGVDWQTFSAEIIALQDELTRGVAIICPEISGDVNLYLAKIAGQR